MKPMNNTIAIAAGMCLLAFLGILISDRNRVSAQSFGGLNFGPIAPTVGQCPAPSIPKAAIFCAVGASAPYAIYVSYNQGAYGLLVPAQAQAGVTSWNGQKGSVIYTPTKVSCTSAKIIKNVFTGTGCTISQ